MPSADQLKRWLRVLAADLAGKALVAVGYAIGLLIQQAHLARIAWPLAAAGRDEALNAQTLMQGALMSLALIALLLTSRAEADRLRSPVWAAALYMYAAHVPLIIWFAGFYLLLAALPEDLGLILLIPYMLLAPLLYCAGGLWALGRAERAAPPERVVAHEHWWLLGLVSACIIGTPLLNTRASFPEGAKLSTREAWMEERFGAAYTAARARFIDPADPALTPILGAGERQRWATPDEPISYKADGVDMFFGLVGVSWSYSITSPDAGLRCQFAAMWGAADGWSPLASFDDDKPPVGSWCRALQPIPRASWRGAVSPRVLAREDAAQVCPYVVADVTGAVVEVGAFTGTCSWY